MASSTGSRKASSSPEEFVLTAHCLSREAVRHMASNMLGRSRHCEPEILAGGASIEPLHQYRVNLRKARSLISLLKQVYPSQIQLGLKKRLSVLSSKTNELRDLDVFLQDWNRYVSMLPEALHVGMMAMFVDFESNRRSAKNAVDEWLKSVEYQREMESLLAFFDGADEIEQTSMSHVSVYPVVIKKLRQRYHKISRLSGAVTPDAGDETLHKLRIECKKMRYLFDFFGCLYERKTAKKVLKNLKGLQDKLGRFNDCSVQQTFLKAYLHDNKSEGELTDSVQALLKIIERQKLKEKARVWPAIKAFSDHETYRLLERLT